MRAQKERDGRDERYIRPPKANKLMKLAQETRQSVYIYGVCGYGKTAFVQDVLARRKYVYYSLRQGMAVLQDFEAGSLRNARILVVDDIHLADSIELRRQFFAMFQTLCKQTDTWLIMLSRAPLPPWLKPLHIHHSFVLIKEEDLAFRKEDVLAYCHSWKLSLLPKSIHTLCSLAYGHPLFLRIVILRLLTIDHSECPSEERLQRELAGIEAGRKDWWDYLETCVFDEWRVELQEFLMDISIVERFDLRMAQFISRKQEAAQFLQEALESGNFLIEESQGEESYYELRSPMKLAMRRRLRRKCSSAHIKEVYRSAGNVYEMQGAITEALAMYEACQDEEGISRLLIENTRKYAGAGHYWELRRFYQALPKETIRQSPELLSAMSMLESILLNDEESEAWYHELVAYMKKQTGSERKAAQERIVYLDVALPHRGTKDMVSILKKAFRIISERKTMLPELSLTNNQPSLMHGGKDFCAWSLRDKQLAVSIGKIAELVLGRFGKGLITLALAESYFEKGEDDYEVSNLALKGRIQAESGGKLELMFVAVGLLGQLSILHNHIEDALEALMSFRTRAAASAPQLLPSIDTLTIRYLLYQGYSSHIMDWLSTAPKEDVEFCSLERYRYIVKARVYLAINEQEKALTLLQQLIEYAQKRQRTYLWLEAMLLLAITQHRRQLPLWTTTLQEAVRKAEEYHFVRILSKEGAALYELLKSKEIKWQNSSYKKQVLQECKQMAQQYPGYLRAKIQKQIQLSDKAITILRMQAEGMSVEQISEALGLSKAGVKYYNQKTYEQLQVKSKAAAIKEASNRKLI